MGWYFWQAVYRLSFTIQRAGRLLTDLAWFVQRHAWKHCRAYPQYWTNKQDDGAGEGA
jgi:hypothetical protein